MACTILRRHGIAFEDVDISNNDEARRWVAHATGTSKLPQLFVGREHLEGGVHALLDLVTEHNMSISDTLGANPNRAGDFTGFYSCQDMALSEGGESDGEVDHTTYPQRDALMLDSVISQLTGRNLNSLEDLALSMRDRRTGVTSVPPCTPGIMPTCAGGRKSLFSRSGSSKKAPATAGAAATSGEPDTFTGQQAVDWLLRNQRVLALHVMQQLLDHGLLTVVTDRVPDTRQRLMVDDDNHFYRLAADIPPRHKDGEALNTHYWWSKPARPAHKVAEDLRRRIIVLYDRYVNGRTVSYQKMREDDQFWEFVDATAELQQVDLSLLSRSELMAMFINLYNVLVIHALVIMGGDALDSKAKRMSFYSTTVRYNIGGHDYSADDIEHGVLRGNRKGGLNLRRLLRFKRPGGVPFENGDPRLRKVVEDMDPRIHFTLVCGAASCPPIRVYSAENLEEGLQAAAEAYCSSEVELRPSEGKVVMSKLFRWYADDFGSSNSKMLMTVKDYLPSLMQRQLSDMMAGTRKLQVQYKPYDWSLNSDEK